MNKQTEKQLMSQKYGKTQLAVQILDRFLEEDQLRTLIEEYNKNTKAIGRSAVEFNEDECRSIYRFFQATKDINATREKFNMSQAKVEKRLLKAIENGWV